MTTQSGTIDGVSYASSKNVYDPVGDGIVTDILYYDQAGTQVADRTVFAWPPFASGPKTVNADGSFSITITPPPSEGGVSNGYLLETFSNSGFWQREDVYSPIFNSQGGLTGYEETSYTVAKVIGPGSSGSIDGAFYDRVLTSYTPDGRAIDTTYQYDLNGATKVVATQYFPNPILTVPQTGTATAGTSEALRYFSVSDLWAANHPGSLALTISTDAGTVSGNDGAGHSFSATAGSGAHLTGTLAQINADLASLSFIDPAAGTAHITFTVYDQAGVSSTKQDTITVSGSGSGGSPNPVVGGPSSATIPADAQIHTLTGITFSDPWAANHAGSLALNVFTTLGTVSASTQNGTNLHLTGTYSQIASDLAYLGLASNQAGSGTVRIEVYDQAGVEAVHLIGVTAHA